MGVSSPLEQVVGSDSVASDSADGSDVAFSFTSCRRFASAGHAEGVPLGRVFSVVQLLALQEDFRFGVVVPS